MAHQEKSEIFGGRVKCNCYFINDKTNKPTKTFQKKKEDQVQKNLRNLITSLLCETVQKIECREDV